jgi:hypothetical protein
VLIAFVSAMESRRMLRESLAAKSGQPAASGKVFWNLPAPRAVSGDYLIAVDARQREAVRKWLIACGLYPLVLAALTVAMVLGSGSAGAATEHEIRALLLYAYGPAVALAALANAIDGRRRWRSLGQRIGTDGSALLYDAGDGVVSRHEWDTVLANRRSLLIGSKMVSLYGGLRSDPTPVFPFDELREVVLAPAPHGFRRRPVILVDCAAPRLRRGVMAERRDRRAARHLLHAAGALQRAPRHVPRLPAQPDALCPRSSRGRFGGCTCTHSVRRNATRSACCAAVRLSWNLVL